MFFFSLVLFFGGEKKQIFASTNGKKCWRFFFWCTEKFEKLGIKTIELKRKTLDYSDLFILLTFLLLLYSFWLQYKKSTLKKRDWWFFFLNRSVCLVESHTQVFRFSFQLQLKKIFFIESLDRHWQKKLWRRRRWWRCVCVCVQDGYKCILLFIRYTVYVDCMVYVSQI